MTATTASIQPNSTITGPALPEPVEVHAVTPMGASARIMGVGRRTGAPYNAILTADQLAALEVLTDRVPFDGDARKFRLGIEAYRLGLAHEYDPDLPPLNEATSGGRIPGGHNRGRARDATRKGGAGGGHHPQASRGRS